MIKKLLLVAVIGGLAFAALKGSKFAGFAKHEAAQIEDYFDSKVPVEKKISGLRKEVRSLDKDIDRVTRDLAAEIVNVRETSEELTGQRTALLEEQTKARALGDKIKAATQKVSYGTVEISVDDAKVRLDADVRRVMARKTTVDTLTHTLTSRERIKEFLTRQKDELVRQKVTLTAQIDDLEAEYKSLQLAQMESKFQFDDTRLAKIKETLRDLKRSVDVKKEELKLKPTVTTEDGTTGVPANGLSVDDILARMDGKKSEKKLD